MENLHNPQPDEVAPDEVAPDEVAPDEVAPDEVAPDEVAFLDGGETQTETFDEGAQPDEEAPDIFAATDLEVLGTRNQAPKPFEDATRLLVDFCLSPEAMYGNGNPYFGRFAFCEAEQTAIQTRAMFRLLRAALDFLEADYLSCEEEERVHLRARLTAFEQLSEAVAA